MSDITVNHFAKKAHLSSFPVRHVHQSIPITILVCNVKWCYCKFVSKNDNTFFHASRVASLVKAFPVGLANA